MLHYSISNILIYISINSQQETLRRRTRQTLSRHLSITRPYLSITPPWLRPGAWSLSFTSMTSTTSSPGTRSPWAGPLGLSPPSAPTAMTTPWCSSLGTSSTPHSVRPYFSPYTNISKNSYYNSVPTAQEKQEKWPKDFRQGKHREFNFFSQNTENLVCSSSKFLDSKVTRYCAYHIVMK